ncbi:hypothetical protein KRR38_11960 [Novosphingobium sp. G106]|nr:hypothetical protein [Novosphingobium sp. G106]
MLVAEVVVETGDVEIAAELAAERQLRANFIALDLFGAPALRNRVRRVDVTLAVAARVFGIEQDVVGRLVVEVDQPGRLLGRLFRMGDAGFTARRRDRVVRRADRVVLVGREEEELARPAFGGRLVDRVANTAGDRELIGEPVGRLAEEADVLVPVPRQRILQQAGDQR